MNKLSRYDFFISNLLLIAIFIYPIATIILGQLHSDYSHLQHFISELAVAGRPFAWSLQLILILNACLVFLLARIVKKMHPHEKWSSRLIILFSVALFIGGAFPCDQGCKPTSFNGWMHVINLLPSLISVIGTPFLMSKTFKRSKDYYMASYCFILGVLTTLAVISSATIFPYFDLAGLGQRIVLFFQLSFFAGLAAHIIGIYIRANQKEENLNSREFPVLE